MTEFEEELLNRLMPYIDPDQIEAAKMAITMVTYGYDISKAHNEVAVYEGDINEKMLQRFLMSKVAKGCSMRTVEYYQKNISHFFEACTKPYYDVTSDDIRYYLALRVQRDGTSKTTANNERRTLSSFYQFLQTEEILLKNPMNKVDVLKETKSKKKAFDMLDLERIRYGCRTNRERALVEVLASTWCRVTEVVNIKISDIDGKRIIVRGKGDKEREVYLNSRALLAVDVYLKERKDSNPYLFPKAMYTGNAVTYYARGKKQSEMAEWYKDPSMVHPDACVDKCTVESIVRNIGKRAGVQKVHPHRFRRTGATMALRSGMPVTTVSKLLGHESIETTQIYLDISDKDLEQAHEKYVI